VESQNLGKFSQILILLVHKLSQAVNCQNFLRFLILPAAHKLSTLYLFSDPYTIGRLPMIKAQEDKDFWQHFFIIVAGAAFCQISL